MSETTVLYIILGAVVVLFVTEKVPVVLVALGTAIALYFTGILTANEAVAGLGDPSTIFIAALFVISAGLEVTGVTAWAGQFLISKAGESRSRQLVLVMLLVASLTALISLNGAVAALLPVVVVMALRVKRPTSQMLIPMVFAAHAGGVLALTGSPVNVVVSEAAANYAGRGFGFFEFALAGVPLLAGTMAIIVLLGGRLLPHRNGAAMPGDLSLHARTLVEQYRLEDGLFQLRVRDNSPCIGMEVRAIDLSAYPGLGLIKVRSGGQDIDPSQGVVRAGDVIVVRGQAQAVALLAAERHLAIVGGDEGTVEDALFNRTSGLAEVVIPARSPLIGKPVFPGMAADGAELVVLAVQRNGEDLGFTPTPLAAGDHLLVQGSWAALDQRLAEPDLLVVDSPEVVRRQAVPMGRGAWTAIAIMVAMIVALASGLVPAVMVGIVAACAMLLFGVLKVEQAYRAVNWTTVILIGAMTPLSVAMTKTGAAQQLADGLVSLVGDAGPYALLTGLFLLTAIMGQLISNTATALIIIPIAVAAAGEVGISPLPVLMSVCVAAAGAFLTPVATPVNLMVMGPGGYRFGDYWKLGSVCLLWFYVIAVFYVPLVWRF